MSLSQNLEPTSLAPVQRLLEIMDRLRAPDGCPWDREQTSASLKPQLLEECYEVLEAIDSGNTPHLREELGDLLLHIVFQAQIARENGAFTFADIAETVAEKLIRRHPHVFGDARVENSGQVVTQWHEIKRREKPERQSALDGVPPALPALMRAEAVQKKARNVGFDFPDIQGSLAKVREELEEVLTELNGQLCNLPPGVKLQPSPETTEELGDLLFALVNLTRHLKLNAEELLTSATNKFSTRFVAVEKQLAAEGKTLQESSLEEMEAAWNAVKMNERI